MHHGQGDLLCTCHVLSLPHTHVVAVMLTQETKQVFEKLFKYIGKSIKALIDRTDEPHCLRLHKNRVFYVRESLMRRATNVRCALKGLGTALDPVSRREAHAMPMNTLMWHPAACQHAAFAAMRQRP